MNSTAYDGYRMVDAGTGALRFRVRDSHLIDVADGQVRYRVRDGARLVDVRNGALTQRARDDGRVVEVSTPSRPPALGGARCWKR